jgi:hypothetical protein
MRIGSREIMFVVFGVCAIETKEWMQDSVLEAGNESSCNSVLMKRQVQALGCKVGSVRQMGLKKRQV